MEQPELMNAMVLEQQHQSLMYKQVPIPIPTDDQVLIKIKACGICRTDLHVIDAELTSPKLPLIPAQTPAQWSAPEPETAVMPRPARSRLQAPATLAASAVLLQRPPRSPYQQ